MTKKENPKIKLAITILAIVIGGAGILSIVSSCSSKPQIEAKKTTVINDNATSDTPVETLKTLTAHITTVEQQNQKLIEQNNALTEQDKTTLAQFKTEVLNQVQQQMDGFKTQQQMNQPPLAAHDETETKDQKGFDSDGNTILSSETGFVWISDLQQSSSIVDPTAKDKTSTDLAALLNPSIKTSTKQKQSTNSDTTNNNKANEIEDLFSGHNSKKSKITEKNIPYYTIPVNATLTGAIAMQPLIGRVPIDGKVPDPYTFKAIIGPKNLAANGIDIPSDIQGIVVAGVAEGDMLGGCARGIITAMTFVFADGRISTTQAKTNEGLGTIAAANGNPCIAGSFHSDAALFLGATAGLAGLQGYGNALSQSQLSTTTSPTTGVAISTLIGNANKYAFGQGFSASAQAAQTWWNQRVQNSFDFIYVPNVDPQTGKKLELNINITQEIPIDYNSKGRKVFYAHQSNPFITEKLD